MATRVNQVGNTASASIPAVPSIYPTDADATVVVNVEQPAPVRQINDAVLRQMGAKLKSLFSRYESERIPAEQKWLKNLRQYLGVYDPEIERQLAPNRSRAYPRLTRMKCIAMLSRLMNLMFPGNEDNWELSASPSPEMSPGDVARAVNELMQELQSNAGEGAGPIPLTQELVEEAVRRLAEKQAEALTNLIKDQLVELGGDQTHDWIGLNRQIVDSGVKYGIGVLEGPYIRKIQQSGWVLQAEPTIDPATGQAMPASFQPVEKTIYKPMYEHLPVWDFYPDMSARTAPGEGYFKRKILGRSALRKLANRADFFERPIKQVLQQYPGGNFKQKSWETELRTMGLSIHADTTTTASTGREKYQIVIWKGPISANTLMEAGADVPEAFRADDVDAEIWFIEDYVIKAEINPWRKLGVDVQQVHVFNFDEDDTSPIGQGLPGIVRDSQLSICAATRMTLDNASITTGPNLEINTRLLRADQDLTSIEAWKLWYRDDDGPSTQFPAVRELNINGHLGELQNLVRMFLEFADMETFIGPATGGDFQKMPSEPMRTAAGASMLRGDAALPFKDIVRNYDSFTQSVIWSLVQFNKVYNPDEAPGGDYDVIPRGATSLIAKEVRGAQIDMLSQTMTPEERDHVNERKFVEAKFASRDLQGMLVSETEASQRKMARAEAMQKQADQQSRLMEEEIRGAAANAFKSITQGQKNAAAGDKTQVDAAVTMTQAGAQDGGDEGQGGGAGGAGSGSGKTA